MEYKGINIEENVALSKYTSFHIGGPAKYFVCINNKKEIPLILEFAKERNIEILLLGGGNNLLVSDDGFNGLVILMNIKGIDFLNTNQNTVIVKISAGEVWDLVVQKIVDKGYWGVENLSLIPGSAGALPVQNVGAYGQEASQIIKELEVYDIQDGIFKILNNQDCNFAYRKSIFNSYAKGKYIITAIFLSLNKKGKPNLNYADLQKYFTNRHINNPDIKDIREAVIFIRKNKLPSIKEVGSAGSFFKNIILSSEEYQMVSKRVEKNFSKELSEKLNAIKRVDKITGKIKLSTGFILDTLFGFKGKTFGGAKIYDKQSLVIVNYQNAKSSDVMNLFRAIRQEVYQTIGVALEMEPNLIGFNKKDLNYYFDLT